MGPEGPRLRRCGKRHVKHVGLYTVSMSFGDHRRVSVDDGSRDDRTRTPSCLFGIARAVPECGITATRLSVRQRTDERSQLKPN
jgi:hypothetical protein